MIRVRAPSRLHFGLLHLPSTLPASAASRRHLPQRLFGGVGLMIEDPGVQLTLQRSQTWEVRGPGADRVGQTVERIKHGLTSTASTPQLITVEKAGPEHAGLGLGTQLALAVTRGLAAAGGLDLADTAELARLAGRGERSALGIHGFAQGGFLVEAGKKNPTTVSPLVARLPFPEAWRILVILAPGGPGLHGLDEKQAFDQLQRHPVSASTTDLLCRLALLGMLPALAEQDWPAFGEALYEFNVLVGEAFALVQGGIYANAMIGDLVHWLRQQGIRGAGQSSWGPAVFAIAQDEGQARSFAGRLRSRFTLAADSVLVTRACNTGAKVEHLD
jgi:beta-RFAP synthase